MFRRGSVAVVAAGLVLALAGCGGGGGTDDEPDGSGKGSPERTSTRPPSKELVNWVGATCELATALKDFRTQSEADLKEIRNPDEEGSSAKVSAMSYLVGTPLSVDGAVKRLKGLGPSGVPAADRTVDAWLEKAKGVGERLDKVSPDAARGDAEGSVADADKLVQSLAPTERDLLALTKKDPQVAGAYKRAEQCAPGRPPVEEAGLAATTGPLPKAADGRNTDACSDGECEVLVTSAVDITANGVGVHATTGDSSVSLYTPSSVMTLGGRSSTAQFGDDLAAIVVGLDKKGAVLKFTIP